MSCWPPGRRERCSRRRCKSRWSSSRAVHLGGDQQVGARIAEGTVDLVIFFWDPLQPQPHDPDVKALLRIAVVWNIPVACNRASADYMISSPLLSSAYKRQLPEYEAYRNRMVKLRSTASLEPAPAT